MEKIIFWGGDPTPPPTRPPKIGIDSLAQWPHSVKISGVYEHANSKYTTANMLSFIMACRGTEIFAIDGVKLTITQFQPVAKIVW